MVRNRFEFSLFALIGLIVSLAILAAGVVLVALGDKAGLTEIRIWAVHITTRSVGVVAICISALLLSRLLRPLGRAFASNIQNSSPGGSAANCANVRWAEYRTCVSVAAAQAQDLKLRVHALVRELEQETRTPDLQVGLAYTNRLGLLADMAISLADAAWLSTASEKHGGVIGRFGQAIRQVEKALSECRGRFQKLQTMDPKPRAETIGKAYRDVAQSLREAKELLEQLCQECQRTASGAQNSDGTWQAGVTEPAECGRVA